MVQINETAALKMEPDTVDVTKGEKVCFEATNVGGVTHDFHVGLQSDIDAGNTSALVGTEPFVTGTMTVEFTFSGDGPYGYVCVIHRLAGMKGPINLK